MDDASYSTDTERLLNKPLRQYNYMYHRCIIASREVIYHLFMTYSSSFYGTELWLRVSEANEVLISRSPRRCSDSSKTFTEKIEKN